MTTFNFTVTIAGGRISLKIGNCIMYLSKPAGKILVACLNKIVDGCSVYTGTKPRPAVKSVWMRPL